MKKQRLAKGSPWVLAAACALLTLIITVFAITNYNREKQLMTEGLVQKGITIIRFIVSGSRASLRSNIGNIQMSPFDWTDHIQQVMERASEHPGVDIIALVDSGGRVMASSVPEKIGTIVDRQTLLFLSELERDRGIPMTGQYRIASPAATKSTTFQVASLFPIFGMNTSVPRKFRPNPFDNTMMERMRQGHFLYQRWLDQVRHMNSEKIAVLVELNLKQFNNAMSRQRLQIIFLSLVLLLVGIGGWLSLLTLQGLKGSQTRLRTIRAFTDMLISSLPVGLIATDNRGDIRICNTVAEDILGVREEEIAGSTAAFVLPRDLAAVLTDKDVSNTEPLQKKIVLIDHKNRSRTLQLIGISVVDSGKHFAGNMLLIQDLSQVIELEEELLRSERLAALGKMAAGVAHELRNPLSSIKGLAVLLKSKFSETSHDRETADILVGEVERLNRSIGELLDYARPEKLRQEKVDLKIIIQKAISLIRIDAEETGVKIEIYYNKDSSFVLADQDKLNQVFLNLFINAIQAMEQGGMLKIHTFTHNGEVVCRVEDTGCGLGEDSQPKVFDPYFTTKPDGTGLGLAMSAKIVEEHGGTIEFQSEKGVGTVVTVRLPITS